MGHFRSPLPPFGSWKPLIANTQPFHQILELISTLIGRLLQNLSGSLLLLFHSPSSTSHSLIPLPPSLSLSLSLSLPLPASLSLCAATVLLEASPFHCSLDRGRQRWVPSNASWMPLPTLSLTSLSECECPSLCSFTYTQSLCCCLTQVWFVGFSSLFWRCVWVRWCVVVGSWQVFLAVECSFGLFIRVCVSDWDLLPLLECCCGSLSPSSACEKPSGSKTLCRMRESLTGASLHSAAVYASFHSHRTHIIKHIHINMYLKCLTFILKHTLRKHVFHYGKCRCIPRAGHK